MFYKKNNIQIIDYNYNYLNKKKLINTINILYTKFNLPKEVLTISLNYLNKLNNINKNIILNDYVFISIIISLKYIEDYSFNIENMCNIIDYDFDTFKKNEIQFLKLLNWELFIN